MPRPCGSNSLTCNCTCADVHAHGGGGPARRRCSKKQGATQPGDRALNDRYHVDFWGKAGGRRKPGRKKAGAAAVAGDEKLLAETQRNNEKDLRLCRELLVTLDEEVLRSRLVASRWDEAGCSKALAADMASGRALDELRRETAPAARLVPRQLLARCSADMATG